MDEIDIERNAADDCIDDTVWARILKRVANSEFHVAIVSPPCNKWSRAPWSNENGPSPCRSAVWPMGFPWATGLQLQKCEESNLLVLRALEICEVAFHAGTAYVLEHPEDLGVLQDGGDPASIWQLPRTTEVAKSTKAVCAALLQCSFGAPTAKPTRLMGTLDRLAKLKYVGWPRFDAGRRYLGPLPPHCGHVHTKKLIGWDAELGSFRTAPSAAYPPLMCEWLAEAIILHVSSFNVQNSVKQPPTGEEEGQGNLTDKKDLTMENLTMENHTTQVACSSDALDITSSSDALDNMSTVKGDTPPSAGHPTQIASSSNTLPEKRKKGLESTKRRGHHRRQK
jgi:hypothetical protein